MSNYFNDILYNEKCGCPWNEGGGGRGGEGGGVCLN